MIHFKEYETSHVIFFKYLLSSRDHSMTDRIIKGRLSISKTLYDFMEKEVFHSLSINSDEYWTEFENIVSIVCLNKSWINLE